MSVRRAIDELAKGQLKMHELAPDAQAMIRKGALELKSIDK